MREQIDRIYDEPQPNEQIAATVAPFEPAADDTPVAVSEPSSPLAMPNLPTVDPDDDDELATRAKDNYASDHLQTKAPKHGRVIAPLEKKEAPVEPVYEQTHSGSQDMQAFTEDRDVNEHWKKYHSAWQSYYQQYYERYYVAQAQKQAPVDANGALKSGTHNSEPGTLSKEQAVNELRSSLMKKVEDRTRKIRKSRHFLPALIAVSVALVFTFLQYNPLIAAAIYTWATPASTLSPSTINDPTASTKVSEDPRIVIPKINVDAPVVYDVNTLDEPVIQARLKEGVVHYPIPGASAFPGQIGNSVVLGHSSNDVFDDGQYKFIFVQLDRLEKNDRFYLHYKGTRYTYLVTEKKVIDPTEVGQLVLNNGKPMATLVTCTPPGTALKRLIVVAEQVSPDPAQATTQTSEQTPANSSQTTRIGGDTRSFFDRLFSPAN